MFISWAVCILLTHDLLVTYSFLLWLCTFLLIAAAWAVHWCGLKPYTLTLHITFYPIWGGFAATEVSINERPIYAHLNLFVDVFLCSLLCITGRTHTFRSLLFNLKSLFTLWVLLILRREILSFIFFAFLCESPMKISRKIGFLGSIFLSSLYLVGVACWDICFGILVLEGVTV